MERCRRVITQGGGRLSVVHFFQLRLCLHVAAWRILLLEAPNDHFMLTLAWLSVPSPPPWSPPLGHASPSVYLYPLICSNTNISTNVYHLSSATAWLALFIWFAQRLLMGRHHMLLWQQQNSASDNMTTHFWDGVTTQSSIAHYPVQRFITVNFIKQMMVTFETVDSHWQVNIRFPFQ